jgi:hypothetical protein
MTRYKVFWERDQRLPVVRGERESKSVTFDRTRAELETLRNIVVLQPCRIEPFFQGFHLPGVSEDVAKPRSEGTL